MLAALVLSYTLPLPSHLRFAVVGILGLTGWGVSSLAKNFKRSR